MQRSKLLLCGGLVAVLSACADRMPLGPEPDSGTASTTKVLGSSITLTPTCGTDCRATIQNAVNTYETVRFSAGTYPISGTVTVPSNTRLLGAGATSSVIRQNATGADIFTVSVSGGNVLAQNVTVDSLGFRGTATGDQMAVRGIYVSNLKVRDNRADSIGILFTYPQGGPRAYADVTAATLSRGVEAHRNVSYGPSGGQHGGLNFYYTRDVVASHNHIFNHSHGIVWVGGDANHNVNGGYGNTRWAKNYHIFSNTVHNVGFSHIHTTGGGIWGGMGDSILVEYNDVRNCLDVCLDAEGSDNVTFFQNLVVNAALGAPLAVFFGSRNVRFHWNHVIQDGSMGNRLFITVNPTIHEFGVTLHVNNNVFEYTGTTGHGIVMKEPSEYMGFHNNTLINTVVDFSGCGWLCQWNGQVEMGGNQFSFTRAISQPAIRVGHNWSRQAIIGSNTVSSTVSQWHPAIQSTQNTAAAYTHIFDNDISGFGQAVEVSSSTAPAQTFVVEDNRAGTGQLAAYLSGASHTLVDQRNSWNTGGGGPGPCDPYIIC